MANVAQAKYLFALNRLSSFYHSANGMLRSALVNIEAREPLNNSLRTQSFRLVRPLGQGKEGRDFEGVPSRGIEICPSIEKAQQLHPSGHAEYARSYSEAPKVIIFQHVSTSG